MQSVVLNSGLNKLNNITLNRSVAVKKTNIDKIINECNIPLQIKNDNQKKMNEINENINFLHNLHWSNKTESNSHILRELMKDVFESEKDLFAFKQYLDSLQLSNTYCDDVLKYNSIGPLHKYDKDDKLFWRKVKGDGNCFYRAFLFAFFENIIFTSNIIRYRNIRRYCNTYNYPQNNHYHYYFYQCKPLIFTCCHKNTSLVYNSILS